MADTDAQNRACGQDLSPGLVFSDRSFSKPERFRTVRKSSYVNEAMLDLDQGTEIPVSLTGSNGFNIR